MISAETSEMESGHWEERPDRKRNNQLQIIQKLRGEHCSEVQR